jgi:hypothetical protein
MSSIIRATTTSGLQVAPDNSGSLVLQTNGTTTAVTLDTSQNATFAGKVTSTGALTLASNGTTTAVTIDTSQNIGVGTTSPSPKITVARTATTSVTNASYYLGLGGTENLLDSKRLIGMGYSSGSSEEYPTAMGYVETSNAGYTNGAIAFYTRSVTTNTAPSERMRIDSSGNVLIGTTSGGTYSDCRMTLSANSGTTKWDMGPYTATPTNFLISSGTGGVYLSGSATSWSALSDERQKTNLVPIADASNKLNTLRTVTGRYITDEETISRAFLIAQDVQKVLPEAVDAQEDEEGTLGLRYTDLIPLLIAGFKEQQTIINDLKARIETLEGAKLG